MNNNRRKEITIEILLMLGIIVFLTFIIATNIFHFNYNMNADLASDAILAKLIWTSKEIIPSTWYVANETRIICTPNLAALFYGLTQNMTLATGLACSAMTILILASIFYFARKIQIKKMEAGMFVLLGLVIPLNMTILELLYLFASYYAIHVVILFLTLGVYAEDIIKRKVSWFPAIISIVLAFCLGIQGVRGILVLYGPLAGIEIIRICYCFYCGTKRERSDWIISIWVYGLLIVSWIGTCFPFSVGQGFSRNIRKGLQKLVTVVIPDMGKAIGFGKVSIPGEICLGIMMFAIIYLLGDIVYRMWKKKTIDACEWVFLVISGSPLITALIVAFTTVEDSERYYFLMIYAMAFAVVLIWRRISNRWRLAGGILIAVMAIINIYTVYLPILAKEDPPETDDYEVGKWLEANECFSAYATFENANTITVLMNGKVRVAPVASVNKMDICKWMTSTDWYVPNVPFEEKTAYVITEAEANTFMEFLQEHKEVVLFETKIGTYLIYTSDYNFSVLE